MPAHAEMLVVVMLMLAVQQPAPPLEVVEVVGCLDERPAATWIVMRGSDPVVTKTQWTTAAAVAQASSRPLGMREYRLIGVRVFSPAAHKGHKVAVKGVLIPDAKEARINVTSMQTASETCTK